MRRAFWAVALLAVACFLVRVARVDLTGTYVDPVGKIAAQDEAYYANPAIAVRDGEWLTPHFLGRYALFKPPLQVWAAAVSGRTLGISRLGLRLPVAILHRCLPRRLREWGPDSAAPIAAVISVLARPPVSPRAAEI